MEKKIIIIGAGPAGYVAALHASAEGAQVTLVGTQDTGGTCLQRGCIPTKTLVASCELLDKIRKADQFGIVLDGAATPHWPSQRQRIEKVVGTMVSGVSGLLDQRGIEQIPGHARLIGPRTVEVDGGKRIDGDYILVCTGSRPATPAMFPFDGNRVVTSDDALQWESLPESLVVVGGGVIACEFAFIFHSLGVDVSVIEAAERPLPTEDEHISTILGREMRKRRIRFIPSSLVEQMLASDDGVSCYQNGKLLATAERALIAIGRTPNVDRLDLENIGINVGLRGEIPVDNFMRTSIPTVYAAGDVTGKLMLAHAASAQSRLAVDHMLGYEPSPLVMENIPRVTFTQPEVSSVGLTEADAIERGLNVRCGNFDLRALGKAHAMGELAGMVKVVADAKTRRLIGVHIIGAHSAEMIHEAAALINHKGTVDDILATVHAHPTLSEAVLEAAEATFGFAIHKVLPNTSTKEQSNEHISSQRLSV